MILARPISPIFNIEFFFELLIQILRPVQVLIEYFVRFIFAEAVFLADHVSRLVKVEIVIEFAVLSDQGLFLLLKLQIHLRRLTLVLQRASN